MNGFDIIPLAGFLVLLFFILGRIAYLKKNGIEVSSPKSGKKTPLFFLYFIFTLILLFWLFEITKPVFQVSISLLPDIVTSVLFYSPVLQITGTVIIMFALVFLLTALLHFKKSLRFGLNKDNYGELITSGIFSITRNPFFVSLDFYFLGTAIVLPSPFIICFSIIALISIHFYILKEERFMRKTYGEKYKNYTKEVRRYF